MSELSLFERATREDIEFNSAIGILSIAAIWSLDLRLSEKNQAKQCRGKKVGATSLLCITRYYQKKVEATTPKSESNFGINSHDQKAESSCKLHLDVLLRVIEVRLAEESTKQEAHDALISKKLRKDQLLSLMSNMDAEEDKKLTREQLQKELDTL